LVACTDFRAVSKTSCIIINVGFIFSLEPLIGPVGTTAKPV